MLNFTKELATSADLENDGVWEDYDDKVSFLVARSHNKAFDRLITSLVNKNKRLLDSKTDAARDKSEQIMIQTMAQTVLLGWKGEFSIAMDDKPIGEYSVEKAKEVLKIKALREWIQALSEDHARFKLVQDEAEAKNSVTS